MCEKKKPEGRTFTFGELWTGGKGWWPCEFKNSKGKQCKKRSYGVILLSAEETERLNKERPEWLKDGSPGGGQASYIIVNKLGKVVCKKHDPFKTLGLRDFPIPPKEFFLVK